MPNYSKSGKTLFPITEKKFIETMTESHFTKDSHRGLVACLYYYGVRISEALRAKKEQFNVTEDKIYFDVLERLKKRKFSKKKNKVIIARGILQTAPLPLKLSEPLAYTISEAVECTKAKKRVWPYCRKTGYNIVDRAFNTYPHHFRLTNFTNIAKEFGIPRLKSWSALTLVALDFYMGIVDIE